MMPWHYLVFAKKKKKKKKKDLVELFKWNLFSCSREPVTIAFLSSFPIIFDCK